MAHFDSPESRGYRLRIDVDQISGPKVRVRAHLLNGWARFISYNVSGEINVDGKKFGFNQQVNIGGYNQWTKLADVETTVNQQLSQVNGYINLPTGAGYLPATGRLDVPLSVFAAPSWQDLGGLSYTDWAERAGGGHWPIPQSPEGTRPPYEYIWWRQVFWCGDFAQAGSIKVYVTGENDEFLYGCEAIKRSGGGTAEFNALLRNANGGYDLKNIGYFPPTHEAGNPFNKDSGWADMDRSNDKVGYFWFGSRKEFDCPAIKDKSALKVHVMWNAMGGRGLVTHMYLDGIKVYMRKIKRRKDIKNRFGKGTRTVIDSEMDTLKIDGIGKSSEIVLGSEFPILPPGRSQLEINLSKWAKKPTPKVEFEERYL